jgi:hypothetical protein
MEGVPVVDGLWYEMVLPSVSVKADGLCSLGTDSMGNDLIVSDIFEVVGETIGVRDDGRAGRSGGTISGENDRRGDLDEDRGVDGTGD